VGQSWLVNIGGKKESRKYKKGSGYAED